MKPIWGALLLLSACGGGSDAKVGYYNTAPSVSIIAPPDGTEVDEGSPVSFEALVSDDFTDAPNLNLAWSSNVDGTFSGTLPADEAGLSSYETANLSVGNHIISLLVTDEDGESSRDSITVIVVDVEDAPTINIVHPADGENGYEGEEFEFVATVEDLQESAPSLVITFQSETDGVFCEPVADETGVARCEASLTAGDHLLTFTVSDSHRLSSSATAYFTVVAGTAVDDDGDGWNEEQGDCDDGDTSVSPGATEYYNGRDDDCDDIVDDNTEGYDDDGDGYSELEYDCDDGEDTTYPGSPERYNATDDDCDGVTDEGTEGYDDDGDGYTEIGGDCDDGDASSSPAGVETADGADNDCDGTADEGTEGYDDDGDGYSEDGGDCDDADNAVSPAATETCGDGEDDDCDGSADEENASGCETYYYDYDGDAYGSSSVSGRCLCTSSGYYTSRYGSDCYDYNASANPAATSYYTVVRGDSSYDYNCDGTQSTYYSYSYDCNDFLDWDPCGLVRAGWASGVASCGSSASYITDCDIDWFSCDTSSTTVTQACR